MLQSVTIENFKSFEKATLPLAPLTLLIGANASGKSNFIEGLQLLFWLALGRRLGDFPSTLREQEIGIRGTVRDLAYQGQEISLGCKTEGDEPGDLDLEYQITLGIGDGIRVVQEQLKEPSLSETFPLYRIIRPAPEGADLVQVAYNSFGKGKRPKIVCSDQQSVLSQIATPARFAAHHKQSQKYIPAAASRLRGELRRILFLNPDPRKMRGYSFLLEHTLTQDAATLSSVLHGLVEEEGEKKEVLRFIRALPEQDIADIAFLRTPRNEVMVLLKERFGGEDVLREAALLSDGTLRALAVGAALLSVLPGSTVFIEEIDNGVHPSRAKYLLENIQRIARNRELRVLLTTHNPALLDALPPEAVPDVVACYRDPEKGDSRLVRLEDLASYPELVAQGPLGQLVTKGILDRFLKAPEKRDPEAKVEQGLAWISDFRRKSGTS